MVAPVPALDKHRHSPVARKTWRHCPEPWALPGTGPGARARGSERGGLGEDSGPPPFAKVRFHASGLCRPEAFEVVEARLRELRDSCDTAAPNDTPGGAETPNI